MQDRIKLGEMIHHLLQVDDQTWGLYAFSRDILNQRIHLDTKTEMIQKAIICGKEYAQRLIHEYGSRDIRVLATKLDVNIEFRDSKMTGKRVLFANYTPPNRIEMMEEPVQRAVQMMSGEDVMLIELFHQEGLMDTILGHEIFHLIEDQYEHEIYTRTEKIRLWHFMGYQSYSTIRSLSEIGAMAFTQELNSMNYSPFILDVLLYYSYDSSSAVRIYHDVLGVSLERCRETVEDSQ